MLKRNLIINEPDQAIEEELNNPSKLSQLAARSIWVPFLGHEINKEVRRTLLLRLAAYWDNIIEGQPWVVWDGSPAWCLFYVNEAVRIIHIQHYYVMPLTCYLGPAAGDTWKIKTHREQIQYWLRNAGAAKYATYLAEDIGGTWLPALVSLHIGQPKLIEVDTAASVQNYNRGVFKSRLRPCIREYNAGKQCVLCPVGREYCPRARFSSSFNIVRTCSNGHPGYFRDEFGKYCINCLHTGNFQRELKGKKHE